MQRHAPQPSPACHGEQKDPPCRAEGCTGDVPVPIPCPCCPIPGLPPQLLHPWLLDQSGEEARGPSRSLPWG